MLGVTCPASHMTTPKILEEIFHSQDTKTTLMKIENREENTNNDIKSFILKTSVK